MKKVKIILILLVGIIFLNFGCTTFKVLHVNKEADFSLSNYNTYDFYNLDIDTMAYPDLNKRLLLLSDELVGELENNGLMRVKQNPELLINIGIYMEEK